MRNISFSMTEPQLVSGRKDVTRRLGWRDLKSGDRLRAVRKAMGLKKGERVEPLGEIVVVSVRREVLSAVTAAECVREGFPELSPAAFVRMFTREIGCDASDLVTRIEFRLLGVGGLHQAAVRQPDETQGRLKAGEALHRAAQTLPRLQVLPEDRDDAGGLERPAADEAVGLCDGDHNVYSTPLFLETRS